MIAAEWGESWLFGSTLGVAKSRVGVLLTGVGRTGVPDFPGRSLTARADAIAGSIGGLGARWARGDLDVWKTEAIYPSSVSSPLGAGPVASASSTTNIRKTSKSGCERVFENDVWSSAFGGRRENRLKAGRTPN